MLDKTIRLTKRSRKINLILVVAGEEIKLELFLKYQFVLYYFLVGVEKAKSN
jgi:hypothetical protein